MWHLTPNCGHVFLAARRRRIIDHFDLFSLLWIGGSWSSTNPLLFEPIYLCLEVLPDIIDLIHDFLFVVWIHALRFYVECKWINARRSDLGVQAAGTRALTRCQVGQALLALDDFWSLRYLNATGSCSWRFFRWNWCSLLRSSSSLTLFLLLDLFTIICVTFVLFALDSFFAFLRLGAFLISFSLPWQAGNIPEVFHLASLLFGLRFQVLLERSFGGRNHLGELLVLLLGQLHHLLHHLLSLSDLPLKSLLLLGWLICALLQVPIEICFL